MSVKMRHFRGLMEHPIVNPVQEHVADVFGVFGRLASKDFTGHILPSRYIPSWVLF
jgi:hypothetical protein